MKSKIDELTEKAFYHALNYFQANDRGVDHQRICIQQLMEITGLDFDTCLNKIQNPILSLLMAGDTIGIGESVIENNLRMVTQSINNHLLNLQSNHISIEKSIGGDTYIGKNTYKDIITKTSSPTHGYLLSDIRTIDISKAGLKDHDIGVLVKNLQYQLLNLDKFDVSHNQLGYSSVENLFYTFRLGSPTATYNIKYMNLSNNQIGGDGAKYIASHLGNGQHPNLRCLDVSGNHITTNGGALFIEAMEANPHQEIVIKTHDNTSSKTAWQFLKQAFNYHADKHHTKNTEVDKKWIALYGDDEWAVCRKYLQTTGMVITAGFISKVMKPDHKLETLLLNKIPFYKKIKNACILYQVVKEKVEDIFLTPDFMQCLGVINSKSLMDIDDYTTEMIGSTSDDFIFE